MNRRDFVKKSVFAGTATASLSFSKKEGYKMAGNEYSESNKKARNRSKGKKKTVTLATVLSGRYGYDEALEKAGAWINQAAGLGASHICFPEYYFDNDRKADGTLSRGAIDDGHLVSELIILAKKYSIAIVMGLTEKVHNRRFELWDYYNTALFVDEKGIRGRHRKVFLWVDAEWDADRIVPGNEGENYYPYPPVCDERKKYLPGWSFECFAFGHLERVCGMLCADGLMPPTWSQIIPQSPQAIFYLNGRINLLQRWGPDLGYISKKYGVPIVASNSSPESEAGIFDSDGKCVARLDHTEGIAVAKVTLGRGQPNEPVRIRHWDGEPMEML
ncbi:MAG: carbon-nitrogen hydrolase family protein, partial [Gemmatimonadota bacterium]|nr:carbon-nitrogen hydrolase family protein [Gemmatimonadota bacterium]